MQLLFIINCYLITHENLFIDFFYMIHRTIECTLRGEKSSFKENKLLFKTQKLNEYFYLFLTQITTKHV